MSISTLSSSDKSKFSSYKEKLRSFSISKQGKQPSEEPIQPIDFDPDAVIDDFYADNDVPETKSDAEVSAVYLHYKDRPFRIKFTRTDKKDGPTVGQLKLITSMLLTPELIDSKIEELKPIRKYFKKSQLKTIISTDSLRNCYKDESIQPLDIYCFELSLYEKKLSENDRSLVSYGVYTPSHIFVTVREEVKLPGMRGFKAKVSSKLNGAPAERKLSTNSTPANTSRRPSAAVPSQARALSTSSKSATVVPVAVAGAGAAAIAVADLKDVDESETSTSELEKPLSNGNETTEPEEPASAQDNEESLESPNDAEEKKGEEDEGEEVEIAGETDGIDNKVSLKKDIDDETPVINDEDSKAIDELEDKEKSHEDNLEKTEETFKLHGDLDESTPVPSFGPWKEIDDILADVEKEIVPELDEFVANVPKEEESRIHNHLAIYERLLDKISLLKGVDISSVSEGDEVPTGEVPLSEKRRIAIKSIYQYLAKTNKALHDSEF